jgi:SRSO17 transposase
MTIPSVFSEETSATIVARINQLRPSSAALWGKMDVAQMLAHCNVTYEMLYEDKHKKPNFLVRFILKLLVKPLVTGGKSYKKNTSTAPAFLIADKKQFEAEKTRLIAYIQRTQQLGAEHFEGLASHSFGNLTSNEWNNLFYKHLDHHFTQFGV